jgi:hypothetical protein
MKKPPRRRVRSNGTGDIPARNTEEEILSMLRAIEEGLAIRAGRVGLEAAPMLAKRFEFAIQELSRLADAEDAGAASAREDVLTLIHALLLLLEEQIGRTLYLTRFRSALEKARAQQTEAATNARQRNAVANDVAVEIALEQKKPGWIRDRKTPDGIAAEIEGYVKNLIDLANTQPEFQRTKLRPPGKSAIAKRVKCWKGDHPEKFSQ